MSLPRTTCSIARLAETCAPTSKTHQAASSQADSAAAAERRRTQVKARRLGFWGREAEEEGAVKAAALALEAEGGGVPVLLPFLLLLLFPLP